MPPFPFLCRHNSVILYYYHAFMFIYSNKFMSLFSEQIEYQHQYQTYYYTGCYRKIEPEIIFFYYYVTRQSPDIGNFDTVNYQNTRNDKDYTNDYKYLA